MIIKLTFNEKENVGLLEAFAKRLYNFLVSGPKIVYNVSSPKMRGWWETGPIKDILNPSSEYKLTEVDMKYIEEYCKDIFGDAIDILCKKEEAEDLKSKLEVEVLSTLKDADEGGQNVYWLQHSGAVIKQ